MFHNLNCTTSNDEYIFTPLVIGAFVGKKSFLHILNYDDLKMIIKLLYSSTSWHAGKFKGDEV